MEEVHSSGGMKIRRAGYSQHLNRVSSAISITLYTFNNYNHKWLCRLLAESDLSLFTGFAQPTELLLPLPFNWFWGGGVCWFNLPPSFTVGSEPGLLILRGTLGGETGPAELLPGFIPNFSLSFLFFLQITSSPGWVNGRESSCWLSSRPLLPPNLVSLWAIWFLALASSPAWSAPRVFGFCSGLGSGSISFISLCLLFWPTGICLEDAPGVVLAAGPAKEIEFLASRKSVSGNSIFKMSKKRSCTFLASDLTCNGSEISEIEVKEHGGSWVWAWRDDQ